MSGDTAKTRLASGLAADRDTAISEAEECLRRGVGFLALVEAVRPAIVATTLDPVHERVGMSWLCRRGVADTLCWSDARYGTRPAIRGGAPAFP